MTRSLRSSLFALVLLLADPAARAHAQSAGQPVDSELPVYAQEIVAQLQIMGYERFTIGRTLLGRIRIFAELPDDDSREIIVNPRTGEILRDYVDGDGEDRLIARDAPGRFRPDDYESDDWRPGDPVPPAASPPREGTWP